MLLVIVVLGLLLCPYPISTGVSGLGRRLGIGGGGRGFEHNYLHLGCQCWKNHSRRANLHEHGHTVENLVGLFMVDGP